MKKLAVLVLGVLAFGAFAGVSAAAPAKPAAPGTIVQIAASDPQFSTLVSLVKKAGLAGALSQGSLTVFAPTNAAFTALQKAAPKTFAAVAANKALLKTILTYHVLGTKVDSMDAIAAAKQMASVKTLQGEKIKLSLVGPKLTLNGSAQVVKADIMASNGVIHVINSVIVPPSVKVAG
jgi:transforming growth factor-beta-induced protein